MPATTIAVPRPMPSARRPNPTMPPMAPICSQRARAANTPAMRSGRLSSSVIHATSAPLTNVHPTPQSICVASTATGWTGHEWRILRFVFFHSLALASMVGLLVLLQQYVVTSMLVH